MSPRRPSAASYAVVTSTLALVVALGGTGYAATQIGTKDLKNGAVTRAKLAPNAVDGSRVAANSLTGADIAEGTLSGVDATTVGGLRVSPLNAHVPARTATRTIFSGDGLVISMACSEAANLTVTARSTVDGSSIYATREANNQTGSVQTRKEVPDGTFDAGDTFDLLVGGDGNLVLVTFDFWNGNGEFVSGHLASDLAQSCHVAGYTISGE